MNICKNFSPQKVANKGGILGEKPSTNWCKNHQTSIPKAFTKVDVTKSSNKWNMGATVLTPRPQKHSNFEDPTEVIYLQKKYIKRKIKDRESEVWLKHASGAFGPGADWRRHAACRPRILGSAGCDSFCKLWRVDGRGCVGTVVDLYGSWRFLADSWSLRCVALTSFRKIEFQAERSLLHVSWNLFCKFSADLFPKCLKIKTRWYHNAYEIIQNGTLGRFGRPLG